MYPLLDRLSIFKRQMQIKMGLSVSLHVKQYVHRTKLFCATSKLFVKVRCVNNTITNLNCLPGILLFMQHVAGVKWRLWDLDRPLQGEENTVFTKSHENRSKPAAAQTD